MVAMITTHILFFAAMWDIASASMTLLHKDKQCDTSAGEVYLPSSRKTSDLAACLSSCTSEKACRSVTYYPSGFCSHFVTQCLNTDSAPGANSYTLASDPTSSIVGTKYVGEKCSEGETREGAPGYVFHMNFCLETCAQSKECNSITYAPSGYCHHFTSDCSKRTYMSGALSFQVKHFSTSAAYDIADCGSECNHKETKYLPQTSEYVLTLKHCLESCSRNAECESVSFYYDGFCSHFSAEPRAKSKVMEKVCHKKHSDVDTTPEPATTTPEPTTTTTTPKPTTTTTTPKPTTTTTTPKPTTTTTTPKPTTTTTGNTVTIDAKACDASKGGYVNSGSGVKDSVAACSQSCQDSSQCKSVTFYSSSKWCSHFSTTCEHLVDDSGATVVRLQPGSKPKTTPAAKGTIDGKACDPSKSGYVNSGSGSKDSLAACSQLCQDSPQCKSITFYSSSKWCSHFSTTCEHLVDDSGATTIRF